MPAQDGVGRDKGPTSVSILNQCADYNFYAILLFFPWWKNIRQEQVIRGRESCYKKTEQDKKAELEKQGTDIYMLSLPSTHQNKREPPTPFEGSKKSDALTRTTTLFKNWSAEVTTYMSLEEPRLRHFRPCEAADDTDT
eukprot:3084017-Amphidinium_carterae.1